MFGGTGYWVYTTTATTALTDGSPHDISDIPLVGVVTTGQVNLLGGQLNDTVAWPDFQVVESGTAYTLDEADPLDNITRECDKPSPGTECRMSRIMYHWNGASYDPFDGGTPGTGSPRN